MIMAESVCRKKAHGPAVGFSLAFLLNLRHFLIEFF